MDIDQPNFSTFFIVIFYFSSYSYFIVKTEVIFHQNQHFSMNSWNEFKQHT